MGDIYPSIKLAAVQAAPLQYHIQRPVPHYLDYPISEISYCYRESGNISKYKNKKW